jgi:glucose/arabinose dehydrogenase
MKNEPSFLCAYDSPRTVGDRRRSFVASAALSMACALAAASCSDDAPPGADGGSGGAGGAMGDAGGTGDASDGPHEGGSDDGGISVNRPELVPATDERIAGLRVPDGFAVQVFARDLVNPRMLAVGPDGSVYVTSPQASQVLRLRDIDGDGDASDAAEQSVVLRMADSSDLAGVHGIFIAGTTVYLASVKAVLSATLADGALTNVRTLTRDLPDGGQHPNRTLGVGPDGKLYVSVGSDCNACAETNSEHATMLRINTDGTTSDNMMQLDHPARAHNPAADMSPRIFASGLRNTLGFDWHPATGQLWGSDHGSDGLGDDLPPDELNLLTEGSSYGWPYCWGDRQIDPVMDDPSKALSKEAYCPRTAPYALAYPAHNAPIAFLFYSGAQFPAEYQNDAFVALRGSWNRKIAAGYKVVRVHFENGVPSPRAAAPSPIEDFMTGFLLDNDHQFGRIAGLAVAHDGALLVSEDSNGVIYRIAYGD